MRLFTRLFTPLQARLQTRPHTRLAALGIVGAAMIVLPLVQLLRYQNAELQALMVERASLDPVTQAVEVQRGLMAHRDLASQVLRGRTALEPERQLRQSQVDERVALLTVALASGPWEPARQESDALRQDWSALAGQVATRRINATESDQSHRLLTEQALQVIDLLADASPDTRRGDNGSAAWLAGARAVPRLAWQIDLLAAPAAEQDAAARERDLAAAEASLARTLRGLDATLSHASGPLASAPVNRRALAEASAAAGATADRLLQQLRAGITAGTSVADTTGPAATAALQAQFALFHLVRAAAADTLAEHTAAAQHRRGLLLWTMAALALLALALAAHLLQGLRALQRATARAQPSHDAQPPEPPRAPADNRVLAGRLLDRLRTGDSSSRAARAEPQPLLPPEP